MGTVREQVGKKKTTYLARVRKNGVVDTATFDEKSDALAWITQQEANILQGKPVDVSKIKKVELAEVFKDYIENGKLNDEKKARMERLVLLIGKVKLRDFTSTALETFLDEMKAMEVPRPEHWKKPHPYFNGSMVVVDGKLERGTKIRAPRNASAPLRSSMPCAQATTESEWSLAWRMGSSTVPLKVLAPRSDGCRYQRLDEKSASGLLLCGSTLNQPLTPQASAMRPTSTASAGSSAGSRVSGVVAMAVNPE